MDCPIEKGKGIKKGIKMDETEIRDLKFHSVDPMLFINDLLPGRPYFSVTP